MLNTRKIYFGVLVAVLGMMQASHAQVGIGTAFPNNNAILELSTNNKGLLMPRLNTTQRDAMGLATSDEGMVIYNTTLGKMQFWNGAAWSDIGAGGAGIQNQFAAAQAADYWISGNARIGANLTVDGVVNVNTTSTGTKMLLYDAGAYDFATGIASAEYWFSVPNSTAQYRFYAGTNPLLTLKGTGSLELDNSIINRKIVLYNHVNNEHEFSGLGINSGVFRYQVPATNNSHVFYAAQSSSSSNELMRIQGDGRIGIGTAAPAAMLAVGSANGFQVNGAGNILSINGVSTSFPNAQGTAGTFLKNDGSGNLSWSAGSSLPSGILNQTLRHNGTTWIANSGIVTDGSKAAIGGTAITGANLTVAGAGSANMTLQAIDATSQGASVNLNGAGTNPNWVVDVYGADLRLHPSSATSNNLQIYNDHATGRTGMYVEGNVGIGIAPSIGSQLVVNDGVMNNEARIKLITGSTSGTTVGDGLDLYSNGSKAGLMNKEATPLVLGANFMEKMVITEAGTVGIGTTTPFTDVHLGAIPTGGELAGTNEFPLVTASRALITSQSHNGGNTLAAAETALMLHRAGVSSASFSQFAAFRLKRYSNVSNASFTQMDISLANGLNDGVLTDVMSLRANGNVGIGTTAPTAKLEVAGQVKITGGSPAAGAVLTSDATGLASWQVPTPPPGAWQLTGNVGTNAATHFIGTTDNVPLVFKVNGSLAGRLDQLLNNTFLGNASGLAATGGNNTAIGSSAMMNIGAGFQNTALGVSSLASTTTGSNNVAVGISAMGMNISGGSNTAVGFNSLNRNLSSGNNTAVGGQALFYTTAGNNVGVGYNAGQANITGTGNVFVGYGADAATSGLANAIAIGAGAIVGASNTMVLGAGVKVGVNISTTNATLHLNDVISTQSDIRLTSTSTGTTSTDGLAISINNAAANILSYEALPLNFGTNGANRMVITSTGNVGIGVGAPSELLEVGGNIEIPAANEYKYATAKTHYYSVPVAEIVRHNESSTYTLIKNFTTTAPNYAYFSGGTSGTEAYGTAGVHLPDGATVTALDVTVYDNTAVTASVALYKVTDGSATEMATCATAANSTSIQYLTDAAINNPIIDNNGFSYALRYVGDQGGATNLRFYKVTITYTVTQAD
ncbi:hypothetical protein SAMN05421780_102115 [Flexibacter flexilis DSM 6793]|uniref:Head domain of trimeric autotransporter adhesin n=1 Tax=Flexibacter flexilis DSM 6793 TaxID=927664 RepID=A0A1I1FA82_9BACT|nr:hypothetical protein [Flexibacter flexilis]SFB96379.1 hypothetical protein SAMN05421780_102115 [Flexibacter flexilis DSM 6793]